MCQAKLEDAVIAALDDNEPQRRIRLPGQIAPLGAGLFRSADRIDDDIVPEGELLSGKSPDHQIGSVMRGAGRGNPRSPHRGLSLIHSEHGAAERSAQVERERALPASRQTGHNNQHSRELAMTASRSARALARTRA